MSKTELKEEIYEYLDAADEQTLKLIYSILRDGRVQEPVVPEEYYEKLDKIREEHLSGRGKSYTWEEVKENARKSRMK